MTDHDIRVLKQSGSTYSEIAKLVGVSRQRIQQRLRVKSKRPETCQRCGRAGKIEGHHLDYLTGEHIWLCTSCHVSQRSFAKFAMCEPENIKCPHCSGTGQIQNPASRAAANRNKRIEHGINMTAAAKMMGISTSFLSQLETGVRNWTPLQQSRFDSFINSINNQQRKG